MASTSVDKKLNGMKTNINQVYGSKKYKMIILRHNINLSLAKFYTNRHKIGNIGNKLSLPLRSERCHVWFKVERENIGVTVLDACYKNKEQLYLCNETKLEYIE